MVEVAPTVQRKWMWPDQRQDKQQWPTITNSTNKVISIPPRRYIILLTRTNATTDLEDMEDTLKEVISKYHNKLHAPEPLKELISTFQILHKQEESMIYLHLTNISSQAIRRDLITATVEALSDWTPNLTWIQQASERNPMKQYNTPTLDLIITTITQSSKQIQHLESDGQVKDPTIWSTKHFITHQLLPEDESLPGPERDPERKAKTPNWNLIRKRKSTDQEEITDEMMRDVTIPSSSTTNTYHQTGSGTQTRGNKRPALSSSTTQTTDTSFIRQTKEVGTQAESENGLLGSLAEQSLVLQKLLRRYNEYASSKTMSPIVSVTVSTPLVWDYFRFLGF